MSEGRWITASLLPRAMAPHENFAVKHVANTGLIALLADSRFSEFTRYRDTVRSDRGRSSAFTAESELVDAVFHSLDANSQYEGANALRGLVADEGLSAGPLAAAALFASVAFSEMQRLEDAIQTLTQALERGPTDPRASSELLVVTALLLQRALRRLELGDRDRALDDLELAIERCPVNASGFDRFSTARGPGISAGFAQRDIARTLYLHALEGRLRLKGMKDTGWQQLIRERPSQAMSASSRLLANLALRQVRTEFEEKAAWVVRSRRLFFTGDPIVGPVERTLLHAELRSGFSTVNELRTTLARLRVLRPVSDDGWDLADAVGLATRAGDPATLDAALQALHGQGPLTRLRQIGLGVLDRSRGRPSAPGDADLAVLREAADVLDPSERAEALSLIASDLDVADTGAAAHWRADWKRDEAVLRAEAALVSGTDAQELVAVRWLRRLNSDRPVDMFANRLSRLVAELEWDRVGPSTRQGWHTWGEQQADGELPEVGWQILDELDGVRRHDVQRPTGLRLAMRLLWEHQHSLGALNAEVEEAEDACSAALKTYAAGVAVGTFNLGVYNEAELALATAVVFDCSALLDEVLSFLRNPRLPASAVGPALDWACRNRDVLAARVVDAVEPELSRLLANTRDPFPSGESPEVAPAPLRFGIQFGLLDEARAIDLVARLAGSQRLSSRVEAARALSACASAFVDSPWVLAMLLSTTYEKDAVLRAEAARSLGVLGARPGATGKAAAERQAELLLDEGDLVPLYTLQGAFETRARPSLKTTVDSLAQRHLSSRVRALAVQVLAAEEPRAPSRDG